MLPLTAPDHSSPHSPSPSANNNLPVRLSAKNTSFLHSENPSTPKHSVESYPYRKTSKFHTICSRNFSVLIKSSTKNSGNIFFILSPNFAPVNKLTPIRPPGESSPSPRPPTHSPLPHTTISRRSALRADPDHSSRPQHTPTSPHNNLTPICPPGRSSPSSRPSTPGSGSGVVAPAAQTGALASAACG